MATTFPHHGAVLIQGTTFDRTGIGAKSRADADGAAWVLMRPSTFLRLATPLPCPRPSLEWLADRIADGVPLCPAELRVRLPPTGPAAVSAHDGRHRMTALGRMLADAPMPVRLSVSGVGWNDVDVAMLAHLRHAMRAQRSAGVVSGPLFDEAEPDLGGPFPSGVPPPSTRRCGLLDV